MRRAAGLLVLAAFAGALTAFALGNQARGGLLPTVALPTLPSVTTPTATVPKPDPPPIVTVPAAPPAATPTPSGLAPGRRGGSTHAARKPRRPTVSFRLRAPARVVFTAYGPSPACGVAAAKTVQGRRGMNWIPVTRRLGHRRLEPGTYRVDVVAQHRRLGRTGMRVPRRGRTRRAVAPVLHCSAARAGALSGSDPSPTPSPTSDQEGFLPPRQHLAGSPSSGLPLGSGSGGLISLRTLQLALLAAILVITGAVLAYTVRFYRRIGNP